MLVIKFQTLKLDFYRSETFIIKQKIKMKFILISIAILLALSMIKADDSDKEEIKNLKHLAKILIDKAAINKLNELMNSDSDKFANRENLLVN